MPSVDRFFSSGNYTEFLNWSNEIRERLLGLNAYRPSNSASVLSAEALKNFLAAKLQSSISSAQSVHEMQLQDGHLRSYYTITNEVANEVQLNSIDEGYKDLAKWIALQAENKGQNVAKRLEQQKKLQQEINKRRDTIDTLGDDGNPIAPDKREDSEVSPKRQELDYQYITSGRTADPNAEQPDVFPQIGQDFVQPLTDEMLRQGLFRYNVFAGQRKNDDKDYEFRNWVVPKGKSKSSWEADKTRPYGTPNHPLSEYASEILNNSKVTAPSGTYKFFIEKLHGRYGDPGSTPYKMNPIADNQPLQVGANNFANRKVFAAFIDDYNESYNLDVSEYNFIGRAEKVPAYKSTARKITLEFTILTDHSIQQLAAIDILNEKMKSASEQDVLEFLLNQDTIHWGKGTYNYDSKARLNGGVSTYYDSPETAWQKYTFLAQCCYPYYRTDGKMKEQPLIRLRIADFYDVICYFSNINVRSSVFDVPTIDFNSSYLGEQPMGLKVTLDATVIHDYEPSSEYFGFYHRKQFDAEGDAAYKAKVWGIGLSKNADTLTKVLKKNSPLSIKEMINIKNIEHVLYTTDFQEIQENIKIFKENFKSLKDNTVSLFDQVKQIKLKNIFEAVKSIREHQDFFEALQTIHDKINVEVAKVAPGIRDLGQNVGAVVGAVESTGQTVSDKTTQLDNNLKRVGVNIDNSHVLEQVKKAADAMSFDRSVPKTIGDIIRKIKR